MRELFLTCAVVLLCAAVLWHPRASSSHSGLVASLTLTPGALNPNVTQANIASTVCTHGWTKTVRPPVDYTNALKVKQMGAYGLSGDATAYQEDHLISLELGGDPYDARNLWPEPYPRAHEMDGIENDLNAKVCSGDLSLADAQRKESAIKHTDG
jgi:hypothetical protein